MQKFDQTIAIAYCTDNQEIVTQITDDLSSMFTFELFHCGRDEPKHLSEKLGGFEGPILLLISDNFLRTATCMQQGLNLLNTFEDEILPVVIPGFKTNDEGEIETVSTNFSRFKQIVQYINYWQDRYLELRRKKRTDPDLDNEGFSAYLNNVRDIAAEVGQYLRTLQTMGVISQEAFSDNSYQSLFEFLGEDELWEEFNAENGENHENEEVEEIIEQVQDEEINELSDIDISTIPGMDLLEKTEATVEDQPIADLSSTSEIIDVKDDDDIKESEPDEEDINTLIDQAWNLDYPEAEAEMKDMLKQQVDHIGLRYNLAVLHTQNKAYTKAKREVNALLNLSEADEVLFLAGELADLQGKTKTAIGYFEKLAHQNPEYPHIYYILGLLHQSLRTKDREKSTEFFETALQKNKKSSLASYELALLHLKNERVEDAINFLKKTTKIDKHHPFAHYDLAVVYHQQGAYKKAYKRYQKAIKKNSDLKTTENDIAFAKGQKSSAKEDEILELKNKISELESLLEKRKF